MRYLVDTGVLLRLINRDDALHATMVASIRGLKDAGHETVAAPQNVAEFWNACTRPAESRGGLGLSVEETDRRVRLLERIVRVLSDHPDTYGLWRSLVVAQAVKGVRVHDARLVALMTAHGVTHILTLNAADFRRYPTVTVVAPSEIASTKP